MGTIGGNILLDTRCQWYNQTYFWRSAIGFCLKKDGTACHVVAGGSRCVAAASNDTAPSLMTLGASLEIASPHGRRQEPIDQFWTHDGIHNHRLDDGEILVSVRIPQTPAGHRGAYGKLRDRGAIDYPLLGVAVRLDVDDAAFRQCHPLENIPGDAGWRREMVRVYVRRTLAAAALGGGPVHHV